MWPKNQVQKSHPVNSLGYPKHFANSGSLLSQITEFEAATPAAVPCNDPAGWQGPFAHLISAISNPLSQPFAESHRASSCIRFHNVQLVGVLLVSSLSLTAALNCVVKGKFPVQQLASLEQHAFSALEVWEAMLAGSVSLGSDEWYQAACLGPV